MGRLYKYELKKLISNKILLLTAGIMLAVIVAWGVFNSFASAPIEIDGERSSRYEFNQIRKDFASETDGKVIDQSLLDELNQYLQAQGTKEYMPYYDIKDFVALTIDTQSIIEISEITEQDLYDRFSKQLTNILSLGDGSYSEKEQAYWNEVANDITSAPIIYQGYYEGWRTILNMIKVLVYMSVLFIAISISTIFTIENTRKTDQLIFASKNGKQRLYWAKIGAGITVSISFTAILILLFVAIVALVFGLDGFDTMLQFVLLRPYALSVGEAALILFGLLLVASVLVAAFTMTVSQITKNSIATISIISAMLMISLFMSEVPGRIRLLSEIWYLIPSNLINLNGAFRYPLLTVFGTELVTYQYAFLAYVLLTAGFIILGRFIYGRYQIKAR